MAQLDKDALNESDKALYVIFIITISTSSLCLIGKLVKHPTSLFTNVRRLILLPLTCGALLFSLFPLVVRARIVYEIDEGDSDPISCQTLHFSIAYEYFFFPFVYGMGLTVIAWELYVAKRGSTCPPHIITRFAYIVFPWLFGIVLVLPLYFGGLESDIVCGMYTTSSLGVSRAQYWICFIIPAIIVVIVAIPLIIRHSSDPMPTAEFSSTTQLLVQSSSSFSTQGVNMPPQGYNHVTTSSGVIISPSHPGQGAVSTQFQHPPYDYQHQPQQAYHNPVDNTLKQPQQQPQQPQPGNLSTAPPQYALSPNYAPQPQPQPQQQPQQQPTWMPAVSTTTTDGGEFRNLCREAWTFAAAAAIYFICTLPFGIYNLAYALNEDRVPMDPVGEVAISYALYWLTVLRWPLLCICWFLVK